MPVTPRRLSKIDRDRESLVALCFFFCILRMLVPAEHLEKLPNPLLLEALMYVDAEGYEWIAEVVVNEETRKKLYEVWIKNGEPIAYEIYV